MFYSYVLYSKQYSKSYVGYTANIQSRLTAHNHPKNKGWTNRHKPWEMLFFETFQSKQEAMNREKQLKSQQGREYIKNYIKNNGLISVSNASKV